MIFHNNKTPKPLNHTTGGKAVKTSEEHTGVPVEVGGGHPWVLRESWHKVLPHGEEWAWSARPNISLQHKHQQRLWAASAKNVSVPGSVSRSRK